MTTTTPRTLGGIAVLALAAAALAGCAFIPSIPTGAGSGNDSGDQVTGDSNSELAGTSWSGTDSDGDTWGLEFQSDGTVGLTYDGNSFDDDTDVWAQAGDTVTVHIEFTDGPIDLIGQYAGLEAPMESTGTYDGGTFTLTLTQD